MASVVIRQCGACDFEVTLAAGRPHRDRPCPRCQQKAWISPYRLNENDKAFLKSIRVRPEEAN